MKLLTIKSIPILLMLILSVPVLRAQTLYVPGGISTGIGNNTGNSHVGIGTANPGLLHGSVDKLLDVEGTHSAGVSIGATNSGGREYLLFTYTDGFFYLYDATAGLIRLSVNSAGDVGIGTSTSAAKLSVLGNVSREVARFQGSADVTDNRNFISLYTTNPDYWWEFSGQDPQGGGTLNGLAFRERSASGSSIARVYFAQGGKVGIGTTTPSHELAVNGTIRAREVIVDNTGWPDYVFADDYRLAPLSEVEAHIKAQKHLPGIPSAQEIAEHGVSMGEMQARLLAKVEELTLHLIELKKENDQLRKEMKTLAAHLK